MTYFLLINNLSTGFPRFWCLWITLRASYNQYLENMSNPQTPPALQPLSSLVFWEEALGLLARELSPQQFKTWIQPLKLGSYIESEHLLTITAPNRFKLDWIKKTFTEQYLQYKNSLKQFSFKYFRYRHTLFC